MSFCVIVLNAHSTTCRAAGWQALGQSGRTDGPWQLCKLGREFHETWLCYVQKTELDQLTLSTRQKLAS